MVTDTLVDTFPLARYDASLGEVLEEIQEYATLGADWDAESALPVATDAVRAAAFLVVMVAHSARQRGIPWQPPIAGPSADGGINLEWEGEGGQILVMVQAGQHLVECIIEEAGAPPRRETVSAWEAIDHVLRVIGGE